MQRSQGTTLRQTTQVLPVSQEPPPASAANPHRQRDQSFQQQQGAAKAAVAHQAHQGTVCRPNEAADALTTASHKGHAPSLESIPSKDGAPVPAPESSYCFGPNGRKERLRRIQISGDTTWVIPQRFRYLKRVSLA